MGARLEGLKEGVLMAPLDSRYIQVGFNLVSVSSVPRNLRPSMVLSTQFHFPTSSGIFCVGAIHLLQKIFRLFLREILRAFVKQPF